MTSEPRAERPESALEVELRAALGGQPRPSPSPFFTARVVRRAQAKQARRRGFSALAAYWIVGSGWSLAAIASALSPSAQAWLLFILVPLGFGLAYAWKDRPAG